PHRHRRRHPTVFVFSILMDCSTEKLRTQKASAQLQICEARLEQRKNLWISSSAFGTRPERPIPAIPALSESANPFERRSIGQPGGGGDACAWIAARNRLRR